MMLRLRRDIALLVSVLVLALPLTRFAWGEEQPGPLPLGQALIREGDFALKLAPALSLGSPQQEAEAESMLAQAGIMPRNGWIADYPVTPDILGELRKSVGSAADADRIDQDRDEALSLFDGVSSQSSLQITPSTGQAPPQGTAQAPPTYPDEAAMDDYYYREGPPVVTYYTPPPDFYSLYVWVPYPFWYGRVWCSGFFILNDFHRTVFVNRVPRVISNHFNDVRVHRVHRVDPVARFRGRTFGGIGAGNRRGFIPTGVPRSERKIFNAPHVKPAPPRAVAPRPAERPGSGVRMEHPGGRPGEMHREMGASPGGGGRRR